MTAGREVVEDYRSKGLSLRAHPLAFLRGDLACKGFAPCADLSVRGHVPDVTACIFWWKDGDPARWRDAWQLEQR
jgi:hypothetical protein